MKPNLFQASSQKKKILVEATLKKSQVAHYKSEWILQGTLQITFQGAD